MRNNIAAANWKMNMGMADGRELASAVLAGLSANPIEAMVILAPPFILLNAVHKIIGDAANVKLAAQNCYTKTSGAYTGEISAPMLRSAGAEYVILGHSERREYFNETDAIILDKIKAAQAAGLKAIYCCGEPFEIRQRGHHETYIGKQLDDSILHLSPEELQNLVIAYEPIWAIGTGQNATPEQVQEMHMFIRWKLERKFGRETAENISILYGGSVKANNANTIFALPDVDGGLIGGASLVADDFVKIAGSF